MEKITHSVYALVCPIDNKIKYIGLTKDLKKRYFSHCNKPSAPIRDWMESLKAENKYPIMRELENFSERREARSAELSWILKMENEQGGLMNVKGLKILPKYPEIEYLPKKSA